MGNKLFEFLGKGTFITLLLALGVLIISLMTFVLRDIAGLYELEAILELSFAQTFGYLYVIAYLGSATTGTLGRNLKIDEIHEKLKGKTLFADKIATGIAVQVTSTIIVLMIWAIAYIAEFFIK